MPVYVPHPVPVLDSPLLNLIGKDMSARSSRLQFFRINLSGVVLEILAPSSSQSGTLEANIVRFAVDQVKEKRQGRHQRTILAQMGLKGRTIAQFIAPDTVFQLISPGIKK